MQIIIDHYGTKLSVENERLAIAKGETVKYLIPSKVSAIHIFKACTISSPVLSWASVYEIPVLIYNNSGKVTARIWQPHFGSHAAIRIKQLQYCGSVESLLWLKQLLVKKGQQQEKILLSLPKQLHHVIVLERIRCLKERLVKDTGMNVGWLRSLEAGMSRWYWAGIAHALKEYMHIHPRKQRPAKDRFNSLLNYLYGTLYGMVEGCIIAAGLDPHISIMHRMEYETPSLVFDLIEPFRHWADEFLISLVMSKSLEEDYWEQKDEGSRLSSKGKKIVLAQWFEYLNQKTASPRKQVKRKDQVQQLCTSLASMLLQEYKKEERKKGK